MLSISNSTEFLLKSELLADRTQLVSLMRRKLSPSKDVDNLTNISKPNLTLLQLLNAGRTAEKIIRQGKVIITHRSL